MAAYISLDTLADWKKAAEVDAEATKHPSGYYPSARILRLIEALEAPCGSCHPCNDWAAETWRQAGGELPHKHTVDEWRAKAEKYDVLVEVDQ